MLVLILHPTNKRDLPHTIGVVTVTHKQQKALQYTLVLGGTLRILLRHPKPGLFRTISVDINASGAVGR